MSQPTFKKRWWRSVPLKDLVNNVTKPAMQKRGFYESRLLSEWPQIVGDTIANYCIPQTIVHDRYEREGNKLHLLVDPAWALEVQYMEAVMIERIATYFGYRAIERIVITQSPIASKPVTSKPATEQSIALNEATEVMLSHIEDDTLREALTKLAITHSQTRTT